MNCWKPRYHVQRQGKRTTVSLSPTLAELLAIKLGHTPDTDAAHQAIRQWLQRQLDRNPAASYSYVSQYLQSQVIFALIDRALYERHTQWLLATSATQPPAEPVDG